jgi:hypothetical protein
MVMHLQFAKAWRQENPARYFRFKDEEMGKERRCDGDANLTVGGKVSRTWNALVYTI